MNWWILDGWQSRVTGPDAPDWLNLHRHSNATLVKSNPRRSVWRVTTADRQIYAKEFIHPSVRDRLRHLFRGPQARSELRSARAAADRGVPTVCFVACGISKTRSVLLSEAIPEASPLSQIWTDIGHACDPGAARDRRNAVIHAVARLIACAHRQGFLHPDAHPRNILIALEEADGFTAYFADVYGARQTAHLSDRQAAKSIAQLRQWFTLRATRTERLRFLRKYCEERLDSPSPRSTSARVMMRRLAGPIVAATRRQARLLWKKRDQRILTTNEYFARLGLGRRIRAHVTLRFGRRDIHPTPSAPPRSARQWRELLSASDPTGGPTRLADMMVVLSRQPTGMLERIRWMFAGSPLRRAFVMGHRLRNRDLPTRWPFAVVERLALGTHAASTLWQDAYPDSQSLTGFLRNPRTDRASRTAACRSLAKVVLLMADRGAAVVRASSATFAVAAETNAVLIDDPTDVILRPRNVERDRLATILALGEVLHRTDCLRRTDAVRFLKRLAPTKWKQLWRRLRQP
ncbi:MAG: hypothetical protein IID39_03290 [Planctomycetes bacterium]|nr:hypothetical protein [Planctomycetota bacterium]